VAPADPASQSPDYVRAALSKRLESIGPEQDQIAADFYALEHKAADLARLQAIVDKRAQDLETKLRAAQDDMRRQLEVLLRQQTDMEREQARAQSEMMALRARRRALQDEKIAITRALESPGRESPHRQNHFFPAFKASFAAAAALWDDNKNHSISMA
jgi:chromosome segregation ATPase